MSNSAFDAGIPVLTEIIQAPRVDSAPRQPVPPPAAQESANVVDVPTIDGWLNDEWNRLERKIGGRILQHVMQRLEADIDARVNEALSDVLQAAIEGMANDLKQNLQPKLQQVIFQAVREEVSRMQTPRK